MFGLGLLMDYFVTLFTKLVLLSLPFEHSFIFHVTYYVKLDKNRLDPVVVNDAKNVDVINVYGERGLCRMKYRKI